MYFTAGDRVKYYDCDSNNQLKISAAMQLMQQASSEQLEYLGCSVEKLFAEDMVFLLSKMCVNVHRMPVCSERLVVGTAPTKPRGARFVREFVIDSPGGERLLSAFSLWILVNPATRKILRPRSFPYLLPYQESQLQTIIGDVSLPKEHGCSETSLSIPVRYSHLDVNQHVNNTVYADFICDALPYDRLSERGIKLMVISFQQEAKWGDVVDITTSVLSENEFRLVGVQDSAPCFESLVLLNENRPR